MAKTVNIVDNGGGKYTLVDSDGQTRVVNQAQATAESKKTGIQIMTFSQGQTSGTGYGLNVGNNFPTNTDKTVLIYDAKTKKLVPTSVSDAVTQAYGAQNLGLIRKNLLKYGQLTKSEAKDPTRLLSKWAEIVTGAANDPDVANRDPFKYAESLQKQGFVSTGTGTAGPMTYTQYATPSATSISKTLDSIAADLLGRQLSQEEKAKYFSMLQAEEKKPKSATVTKVTPTGTGAQTTTTSGGLDEQQFLIEKIAGTDEAKAQKVLNAYEAVTKMFGGLQ